MKRRTAGSLNDRERLLYRRIDSPIGPLTLAGLSGGALRSVRFGAPHLPHGSQHDARELGDAADQFAEYFAGRRRDFELPLDPQGTAFQRRVWAAVLSIPWGVTRSYAEIAAEAGSPGAVRAVGAANGANPLPVVVPCHRVIGSDGRLVGYGGGLDRKASLLRHEGVELAGDRIAPVSTLF